VLGEKQRGHQQPRVPSLTLRRERGGHLRMTGRD
jgi:hypothetical protein